MKNNSWSAAIFSIVIGCVIILIYSQVIGSFYKAYYQTEHGIVSDFLFYLAISIPTFVYVKLLELVFRDQI